jgi:hypothetical protein
MCAEEPAGKIHQMASSTPPAIGARLLAQKLGGEAPGIHSAGQRQPDRPPAGEQVIAFAQDGGNSDGDGFLAGGKKLKAMIAAFRQRGFEGADKHHKPQGVE